MLSASGPGPGASGYGSGLAAVFEPRRVALVGASDHGTTKALYARDPDGLEFEVAWVVPADLLDDQALTARERIGPLDLAREKERYGADTPGGIGISVPAPGR